MSETSDRNAATVRRYVDEILNQQNLAALESLLTPDFQHGSGASGVTGQAALLRSRFTAFPDARVEVSDLLADDRQVAVRGTWSGTQRGQWLGVPASNGRVTWGIMAFYELRDGKIARIWAIEDAAALQRQLKDAQAQAAREAAARPPAG